MENIEFQYFKNSGVFYGSWETLYLVSPSSVTIVERSTSKGLYDMVHQEHV